MPLTVHEYATTGGVTVVTDGGVYVNAPFDNAYVKQPQGTLRFDGPNNYGDDLMRVKQVQNGRWVVVWPKDVAKPGAKLELR